MIEVKWWAASIDNREGTLHQHLFLAVQSPERCKKDTKMRRVQAQTIFFQIQVLFCFPFASLVAQSHPKSPRQPPPSFPHV